METRSTIYQRQKNTYQPVYTVRFGAATYVFVVIAIHWMHRPET